MPHASGGIEYYIHHLARALLGMGHDAAVVLPAYPDDTEQDPYCYDGVPVLRYPGFPAEGRLQIAGLEPNAGLAHFRALLLKEQPDIVHFNQLTNSGGISLQHLQAAREAGAKVVYTSHMAEFLCQRGDLQQRGAGACNGLISAWKCADCLLSKRGMNTLTRTALLAGDALVSTLIGKSSFRKQLQPLTLPGFAARWHIHKIRSVILLSDAFVSIAEWSTDLLRKNQWYAANCHTIATGLFEYEHPQLPAMPEYNGNGCMKILYMGRVVEEKGLKVLLKALLPLDPNRVELHVYGPAGLKGSAVYYDECRALCAGRSNFHFHPKAPVKEVPSIMRQHQLLCLPSLGNEMAPLVIQEAGFAGLPVLGAALPAIREWIIDGKNGLLFAAGDPVSLRLRLQQVLDNPGLLEHLRRNIKPPASFCRTAEHYAALYESLLA